MATSTPSNDDGDAPDSFTLFSFVDEVESRVEAVRRQAASLMDEQASLLSVMNELEREIQSSNISPGDCQELIANLERLTLRCKAIDVQVHTVRDEGQVQALEKVSRMLEDLETEVAYNGTVASTRRAHLFLNACLPENVGAVDTRFQSMVLGCAMDDQKEVRRRLQELVRQYCPESDMDSTQMHTQTCTQANASLNNNANIQHETQDENSVEDHTLNDTPSPKEYSDHVQENPAQPSASHLAEHSEQGNHNKSLNNISDSEQCGGNDEEVSHQSSELKLGNNRPTEV